MRELFCLPALYAEDLWQKFEAFEAEFTDERVVGEASNSILPLALGCDKERPPAISALGRGQHDPHNPPRGPDRARQCACAGASCSCHRRPEARPIVSRAPQPLSRWRR